MQRMERGNVKIKSRKICSVPQCSSYGTSEISLHKFPLDPKAVKKWQTILKIKKHITKNMCVCSKHFLKEDFFYVTSATQRKRLKNGSVPSQNLPVTNYQRTRIKDRSDRKRFRQKSNKMELEQHADENKQVGLQSSSEDDDILRLVRIEHDYVVDPGETSSTINPKTSYNYHTKTTKKGSKKSLADNCDTKLDRILHQNASILMKLNEMERENAELKTELHLLKKEKNGMEKEISLLKMKNGHNKQETLKSDIVITGIPLTNAEKKDLEFLPRIWNIEGGIQLFCER